MRRACLCPAPRQHAGGAAAPPAGWILQGCCLRHMLLSAASCIACGVLLVMGCSGTQCYARSVLCKEGGCPVGGRRWQAQSAAVTVAAQCAAWGPRHGDALCAGLQRAVQGGRQLCAGAHAGGRAAGARRARRPAWRRPGQAALRARRRRRLRGRDAHRRARARPRRPQPRALQRARQGCRSPMAGSACRPAARWICSALPGAHAADAGAWCMES